MKKWQIGLLFGVALMAAIAIPLTINARKAAAADGNIPSFTQKQECIIQNENRWAVWNGERVKLHAVPFRTENGTFMISAEDYAKFLSATVETQETGTVLTIEDDIFSISTNGVTYNSVPVTLTEQPMTVENMLFLPAQDISRALGVNYIETSAENGDFAGIYIGTNAPKEQKIEDIGLKNLGVSCTQYEQDAYIFRAGSDHAWVRGKDAVLTGTDEQTYAPLVERGELYLPAIETAKLCGQDAALLTDGSIQIGENTVADSSVRLDGKTVYLQAESLAQALGLNLSIDDSVAVLSTLELTDFTISQKEYLSALGKALPDAAPDIPEAKAYVALTFDDGPTGGKDGLTVHLLDGLKERGAHATFFMCGYRVKDFHTHMDRYLAEGHELGNHTMNHKKLQGASPELIQEQVSGNSDYVASFTGEKPTVMRPTGGAYDDAVKAEMKAEGLPIIMWSLDTLDWKTRDEDSTYKAIVEQAKDGDIILMHDLYKTTQAAVLQAIDTLKEQGYAFVTVSELARIKGVTLEPGEVYSSIR